MIGTVYRIEYNENPEIRYIGSTMQELRYRWRDHKNHFNEYLKDKYGEIAIYSYFKEFGIKNFKIIKIKEYEVVDRKHLLSKEQLWMNKLKNINKKYSFQILKKIRDNLYYENNKDKIKENQKEYRENNKDIIKEQRRKYRENNKDKINEYNENNKTDIMKRYYEKHKDKMLKKITCECGNIYSFCNESRHKKTKRHIKFYNPNNVFDDE
tara:strand:+ start:3053 stop:3682 length:630 start_codon:yes stop_codon:yes gene_type:complete